MRSIYLFISLSIIGCKKSELIEHNGDLSVFVTARDIEGKYIESDGFIVTTSSPVKTVSEVTDNNGKCTFAKLPRDVYTITVTKNGFGISKKFGFVHLNGNMDYVKMGAYEILKATITDFNVIQDSIISFIASINIDASQSTPEHVYLSLFISDEKNVSDSNYKLMLRAVYNTPTGIITCNDWEKIIYLFSPSSVIYIKAYPDNYYNPKLNTEDVDYYFSNIYREGAGNMVSLTLK